MDNILIRRRDLILPGANASSPLYPLDGTHSLGGSNQLIVTDHSHWKITGSGAVSEKVIFGYPDNLFKNQNITYKAIVSNFVITTGTGNNKKIRFGTPGTSDYFDLFTLSSGNGTYVTQHTLVSSYQNLIRLYAQFDWSSSFEFEFDFKLFADDVWIS